MRVRYSKLAKLFGLVVLFLLVVPYLIRSLDRTESNRFRSHEDIERNIDKAFNEPAVADNHLQDTGNQYAPVFKQGELGNFEPRDLPPRSGPGEGGTPVHLEKKEESQAQRLIGEFGFNMVASDKISMDRRIKDTRPDECKYWHYPTDLPTASVVIVFHNEGWSTLMRTVHSAINTSPPNLLAEVVLVDDYSNKEHLKKRLEDYITRFNGKVKLYRTEKREGLVQARVIGAQKSVGEVIVVLDAHCECVTNWLPPLLTRIKMNKKALAVPMVDTITWDTLDHIGYGGDTKHIGIWEWGFLYKETPISDDVYAKKQYKSLPNPKTLAVPIVDGIDWNTIEHQDIYGGALNRGIFEWGFLYKETEVPDDEEKKHKRKTEPYWSPTHAGGLLAISKEWFEQLGWYDPGIKIWGAEQYELSFKVWQCGGVVEWVPCSHVAHIYRGPRTESIHPPDGNPHQSMINHMRLAEVWMDEYKEYYYIREPSIRKLPYGDVSEQKKVRDRLQCKPFDWFMKNIAYDMVKKFPLPPKNKAWGECSNSKNNVCLDVRGANFGQPIGVSGCHHQGGAQVFRLNVEGELSTGEHCFVSDKNIVKKKFCLDYQGIWNPVGEWEYDETTKMIKSNKEKTCMETDGKELKLAPCNPDDPNQKWEWKEFYL